MYFNKDREYYFGKGATMIEYHWHYNFLGPSPLSLHLSMWKNSIITWGTEEQINKWIPPSKNLDIIGCYAQTEIGHGSDISSIQTTATFDRENDEFIIDTPNALATKWWPGDMGTIANYALIFAKLKIPDETGVKYFDYGTAPFIV